MGGSESSQSRRRPWLRRRPPPPSPVSLTASIRQYLSTLNPEQLHYLSTTYATLAQELQHYSAAMRARPTPSTLHQDLSDLLDEKHNTDVEVQLPAANFLAHRPLLLARSGHFAAHLTGGSVKLPVADVLGFSEALRWIYAGEGPPKAGPLSEFLQLGGESVQETLQQLYDSRRHADCLLVWGQGQTQPAHACILSARSGLLRGLLSKRRQLLLDGGVIPFKYSSSLLHWMYTDRLDAADGPTEDLQELLHCAQFLELDSLCHCIETVLASRISASSWASLLRWACTASPYLRRCCLLYAQERWWELSQRTEFYTMPLDCVVELARSDFTQCPESELVDSLLRWAGANGVRLPGEVLGALRLDYITNGGLLERVTGGVQSPSVVVQSRPRYWGPIHAEVVGMVGQHQGETAGGGELEGVQAQAAAVGEEIAIEPDLRAQLLQKYAQLIASSPAPSDNVAHWLRLRALRECGLPDEWEGCLVSTGPGQQREEAHARSRPGRSTERRTIEHPLPDIASNIVDPIVDLDLGDRFIRH